MNMKRMKIEIQLSQIQLKLKREFFSLMSAHASSDSELIKLRINARNLFNIYQLNDTKNYFN